MDFSHVFHIGLNKAGTTSLAIAMNRLGIPSVHNWPHQESFERMLVAHKSPIANLPYRGWFDVRAFERHYPALEWLYPTAKFILTTRNKEDWLTSRELHVRHNIELARQGRPRSSWQTIDREGWSLTYDFRHFFAKSYFQGREEKLLVIDIPAGQGYEVLCPFLGLPILYEKFPVANVSSKDV